MFKSQTLPGGDRAVILFHGLSSSPLEVQLLGRGLQRAGYTVHLPYLPGYGDDGAGESRRGPDDTSWVPPPPAGGLRAAGTVARDGSGLERALVALWPEVPTQRCTVHKHRNLLAHAPEALHEEVTADYNDMIYAETRTEVMRRRKLFLAKWRLKCRGVADSLEEAGERLFTFTRLPPSQWKSARTTNAIERLHEEFRRRIKTQTVLPSAETAAMLFWALLASGQINMRKVDGWQITAPIDQPIDLAA